MSEQVSIVDPDVADPLAPIRTGFHLPADITYLNGHSLGCLPCSVPTRLDRVVSVEWAQGVVRSWHDADWLNLPATVGRKIARLIGAEADTVIVTDSISVNLFKILSAALRLQSGRSVILTDTENFPTDLYLVESVARQFGATVRRVGMTDMVSAIDGSVAVVMLAHVNYRSARTYDIKTIADTARRHGVLTVFDLAHTAGVLSCDLETSGVDFAVGCGYKYLNGGPGAPSFLYVARRHLLSAEHPLTGWFAHAAPFSFEAVFRPAQNISRFLCGTPPILSMAALDAALDVFNGVAMADVERKSRDLTGLFIEAFDEQLGRRGFLLRSERERSRRGGHVAIAHPRGREIMAHVAKLGFVGDFRPPDTLRFAFSPLYNRYADVGNLVRALASCADDVERSGDGNTSDRPHATA